MVAPDDYIMLSALQHYAFCPRQCALIHIEQVWDENLYTLRGQRVHDKVNVPEYELVEGVHVERAMPLWSSNSHFAFRARSTHRNRPDLNVWAHRCRPHLWSVGPMPPDALKSLSLSPTYVSWERKRWMLIPSSSTAKSSKAMISGSSTSGPTPLRIRLRAMVT